MYMSIVIFYLRKLVGSSCLRFLNQNYMYVVRILEPPVVDTEWSCTFDNGRFATNCGMTRAAGSEFNWSLKAGRTPTSRTGPSSAYNGRFYAYIETSSQREEDDDAT